MPRCLLILSLLIASVLHAATPDKTRQFLTEAKEPVRIVCIGDSITGVYYHSGGMRAYPEMLQIALQKLHPKAKVTVRNAGISGDTSKGGLARLERDVLAHKPHLVTIMFGMNDLVRVPVADFVANTKQIIQRCRDAGAEVVLCTQNSILNSPSRPVAKLAEYSQAIRDLAKAESLGLADCHAAFEALHAKDVVAWNFLLSDAIHPNMDGHKLFAETIAKTITGQEVTLRDEPPPPNPLAHTFKLLGEGKPLTVLAMPPYDQQIEPALKKQHPKAQIAVKPWPTAGKTLAELETAAKAVRAMKPNLVLIAVPGHLTEKTPQAFHQRYAWIMNWSLSFGPQEWDVVVALPPDAGDLASRLVKAQDLSVIAPPDSLEKWLWAQKVANPQDIVFRAQLDQTEQRYVERLPPGFEPEKPHDVLIALHGHGSDRWQFINDLRGECRGLRDVAAKHGLIFISPDYRAKTSWMGPAAEADTLQIIEDVKKRHRVNRVFIAGGSMGGTSALIFATLHPELIAGVCALNPTANLVEYAGFKDAIDTSYGSADEREKRSPELHADRLTMPVALTTGGQDTVVPPASTLRLAKKLSRVLSIHHEAVAHSTSYDDTVKAMEFVLREAAKP
ncbi:MAG: prolyl oligopeptidase family serine peptidase [Verrucomicrobiaceae bacterium]|nr:prolyl oligopeptidase family serine peptidase [Verrucomicrobiaceae bacterium]